jgi:hypothetical protein
LQHRHYLVRIYGRRYGWSGNAYGDRNRWFGRQRIGEHHDHVFALEPDLDNRGSR